MLRYLPVSPQQLISGLKLNVLARPVLLAIGLTMVSACTEKQPSKLEQVMRKGKITVVTRNSPTTFYESANGYAGIEYEMVSQFAEFLGVEVDFIVNDNLKEINELVKNDSVDFAAAGLTVTPSREENLRFAPAYQRITSKLVFKQGKKMA